MASSAVSERLSEPKEPSMIWVDEQVGVGSRCYKVRTLILERLEEFKPQ